MFQRLGTKLTVFYAGLFGAAMLAIAVLAFAMAPIALWAIAGLAGLTAICFASWILALRITRPIAALDAAARALEQGQHVDVKVETADEIGRLTQAFNAMSSEVVKREQRMTHMALHDTDTDLLNRRALERAIDDSGGCGCVITLSVERYAKIYGAIGYQLSARLMAELGIKTQQAAPDAIVGRLTADTIGLVCGGLSEDDALAFAERLLKSAGGPLRVGAVSVDISLRAGVAPLIGVADHAPLNHSIIAIDQARAANSNAALFDPIAYGDPELNLSLMSEMINGISRGQLSLYYQPKLDVRTNTIVGAECLVRWTHPVRGRIAPDIFVTMAEQTGHIHTLTEWTLIQAVADQKLMREAGVDMPLSVNLSGRLIGDDGFTELTLSLIEDTGAQLCLEITETAAMHDPDAALRNIERYAGAGVKISIDDYGAGLSSLTYLKRIHAHELKLDKSFAQALGTDSRDALLVRSTIELAHGLGMQVTAEGVEKPETLAILSEMGCDVIQGYLIGRPAPLGDFLAQIALRKAHPLQTNQNATTRAAL